MDMYIPSYAARERWVLAYIIFCVRLLQVCSFSYDGQYQSLDEWDEQQVRLSRFFIVNQYKAKEECPAAVYSIHGYIKWQDYL
ncbi:MAG: hypothetical protein UC662_09740 [Paraprevotella clara]|nr:hypothetical protein [Paraprevotella clara]